MARGGGVMGGGAVAFGGGWDSYIAKGALASYRLLTSHRGRNPAFTTLAPTLGQLIAIPFIIGRRCRFTELVFEVTTGGAAGSVGRVGIYDSVSAEDLDLLNRIVDGGEFDCTTIGRKTAAIDVTLDPGWYHAVSLFGTAAPTIRAMSSSETALGYGYTSGSPPSHQAALRDATYPYAALPAVWDGTSALYTGPILPAIFALPSL